MIYAQGQNPVDPVNWRELASFLGEVSGWEGKGAAQGSVVLVGGFKMSQAERSYAAKDRIIRIAIVDGGYIPMVYTGIKMAMNYEIDTSEEYVKKLTINAFPGIEKYEFEYKKAEVILLISERFLVQVEGRGFEDTSELKAIAENLDLEGIANLAK